MLSEQLYTPPPPGYSPHQPPPPPGYSPNGQGGYAPPPINYGGAPIVAKHPGKFDWYLQQPRINAPTSFPMYDGGIAGQLLESVEGVFISQKTDWMEAITGCERENKYKVKPLGQKKGPTLFKCKEKSGGCSRVCLPGSARPFDMKIENKLQEKLDIWLEREYSMPICCFCRPEMFVYAITPEGNKLKLGRVMDTWDFMHSNFNVYDHEDRLQYSVTASCCQCALHCNFPCKECKEVEFEILNSEGIEISKAKREGKGFIENMMTDADQFKLKFRPDMPWNHRALLMATILFIDFRMFEENASDKNRNHNNSY